MGTAFKESSAESWADDLFERWAQKVFAYQFEANPIYTAYARKRGATPATLDHWSEIPWVPASAFKAVPLISGDSSRVQRVFLTSGTTHAGKRGEHHVLDVDLYKDSLIPNMRRHLYGDRLEGRGSSSDGRDGEGQQEAVPSRPILALTPAPADVPESSLSFMLGAALDELSGGEGGFFVTSEGVIDTAGLCDALEKATARGTAVLLAGTAFAFVHWLDWLKERDTGFELPRGSMIMETGGFKGRSREVPRVELYRTLSSETTVASDHIVNEYGMTELQSQLYTPVLSEQDNEGSAHVLPPWMRARALDPSTLEEVEEGAEGLLAFFDLANAGSVCHVLTEDVGSVRDGRVRLAGRGAGAEPRGCSRAMDDLMAASGRSR